MLIYTPIKTNRKAYIFKLLLSELYGVKIRITNDIEEFKSCEEPKLNYSNQKLGDEFFIQERNFLNENDIRDQDIKVSEYNGIPVLFNTSHPYSDLPFDPFAASFYLVSRYEEYLPFIKDMYGRFAPDQSIAYQKGFLNKPVVNYWAGMLTGKLLEKYPEIRLKNRKFRFTPTIDVDSAYEYKNKGFIRAVGGCLRDALNLDFREVSERISVIFGWKPDPFDTFDYQFLLQKKYNLEPVYFILFADYDEKDKNINIRNPKFINLVKFLADYAEVGIHPSFASNDDFNKLREEVKRLSVILNKEITSSRQHFLKLILPQTYRNLLNMGITDDYTMGYAGEPGFRAGICDSFPFYDLETEKETNLRIHPFCLMEGTLRDYKNISAANAIQHIKPLIDEVKKVNGTLISLWHNESLSDKKRWKGWTGVYEEMINIVLS